MLNIYVSPIQSSGKKCLHLRQPGPHHSLGASSFDVALKCFRMKTLEGNWGTYTLSRAPHDHDISHAFLICQGENTYSHKFHMRTSAGPQCGKARITRGFATVEMIHDNPCP